MKLFGQGLGGVWKLVVGFLALRFGAKIVGWIAIALAVALGISLTVNYCNDRAWNEKYVESLNDAARRDTTRLVYQDSLVSIYEHLLLIEREEKDLAQLETVEERRGGRFVGRGMDDVDGALAFHFLGGRFAAQLFGECLA